MYSKNFSETSQDSSCDVDVCEGVIWGEKSEWVCVCLCLGWVGGPAPVNGCLIKDWESLWKEHIQLDINCVLCYSRIKWVNMYTRNKQKKKKVLLSSTYAMVEPCHCMLRTMKCHRFSCLFRNYSLEEAMLTFLLTSFKAWEKKQILQAEQKSECTTLQIYPMTFSHFF